MIIEDLLHICHLVTRMLASPSTVNVDLVSEYDLSRSTISAKKLNIPSAAKCWQLLLKGHKEIQSSYSVKETTEMVLIRIAYAADLPDLKDLIDSHSNELEIKSIDNVIDSNKSPLKKNYNEDYLGSGNNIKISNFEELLKFVKSQKELSLYADLADRVRLIDYKVGYIECSIDGGDSDKLITSIRNKLDLITNLKWNIVISDEEAMLPFSKLEDLKFKKYKENVEKTPLVESLLKQFPDSEVGEIKEK